MSIRLSHSAANRFRSCPRKYRNAKNWETKKRGSALAFGTALEDGITQMLVTGKLQEAIAKFQLNWENEEGNPKKPVFDNPNVEYYKSDYDRALVQSDPDFLTDCLEELKLDKHYEGWKEAFERAVEIKDEEKRPDHYDDLMVFMNRVYWWSMRLKGRYMLESFAKNIYPDVEKVINIDGKPACQFKIELESEAGDKLVGYVDYVIKFKGRDKPTVVDAKTSSIKYTDHNINTSDQLRTYVFAMRNKYKVDADACYLVLSKRMSKTKICEPCDKEYSSTKRKCDECEGKLSTTFHSEPQLLFTDYSDEMLEQEMDEYENLIEAIDSGADYKNTDSCFAFGRQCEFYDMCWNNKKPEDLDHLKPKKRSK